MEALMEVVVAARKLRVEQNLPAGERVDIAVEAASAEARSLLAANREAILLLARGRELEIGSDTEHRPAMAEAVQCLGEAAVVAIRAEVSREELTKQRERLVRECDRLQQEQERLGRKLGNADFVSRAPGPVVEKTRARLAEARERLEALDGQLSRIEAALRKE